MVQHSDVLFFHGTDLESAAALVSGEPLDPGVVSARHIDGEVGFYLASERGDAEFFAIRRGTGRVISYEVDSMALEQLYAGGAVHRPIPVGLPPPSSPDRNFLYRLNFSFGSITWQREVRSVSEIEHDGHLAGASQPESSVPSVLDPVATVRRHPEWFFRGGHFDAEEAVGLLVAEATRGGAARITVRREGGWISFDADVDWLQGDLAAFFAPQSYGKGGPNSARAEVVLTAFCEAVITATPTGVVEVLSSPEALAHSSELKTWETATGRLIAFLPPESAATVVASPEDVAGTRPQLRLLQGEGKKSIVSAVESFIEKQSRLDD